MKKLFVLLLFGILLCSIEGHSQIKLGAKAGFNLSTTIGKEPTINEVNTKSIAGMQFGAVVNYPILDYFSVHQELLFSQKGWIAEINSIELSLPSSIKLNLIHNYIEMPILLKYSFENKFKFTINAGPYFAFTYRGNHKYKIKTMVGETSITTTGNGKIKFEEQPENYNGEDIFYDPEIYNQFDIGIQVGGGIGKNIGQGRVILDLRYSIGLKDFHKNDYFPKYNGKTIIPDGYKKFLNRTFSVSLIYFYNITQVNPTN